MALPFERLGVLVLAQNIFVELHVGPEKILEPGLDPLPIFQDFFGDVVRVNIDADPADDPEILAFDWDRRAFELS